MGITIERFGRMLKLRIRNADPRSRWLLPLAVATCLIVPVLMAAMPREGRPVAVVAWSSDDGGAAAVAARAEGELRIAGRGNLVVIASSPQSGFVSRLYRAGAFVVLDAAFAVACLPPLLATSQGVFR